MVALCRRFYLSVFVFALLVGVGFAQPNFQHKDVSGGWVDLLAYDSTAHIMFASTSDGIYQSSDEGFNWTKNSYSNRFFSGASIFISQRHHIYFICEQDSCLRSTDFGQSWFGPGDSLPDPYLLGVAYWEGFAENPTTGTILATADSSDPNGGGKIYRSIDGGHHWIRRATNLISPDHLIFTKDGYFVYVAYNSIVTSNDDGLTWTSHPDTLHSIFSFDSDGNGNWYMGTGPHGANVYRSTDHGANWTLYFTNNQSYVGGLCCASNGTLWAAPYTNLYYKTSPTSSWQMMGPWYLGRSRHIYQFGNTLYEVGLHIFASTNNGTSWQFRANGIHANHYLYVLTDSLNRVFVPSDFGILRSDTHGETWHSITDTINQIYEAFNFEDSNRFYYSTTQALWRSTDGGVHWDSSYDRRGNIWTILKDIDGSMLFTLDSGTYRSINHGNSWTLMTPYSIGIINRQGDYFAGDNTGQIYRSLNRGSTWQPIESHLGSGLTLTRQNNLYYYGDILKISRDNGSTFRTIAPPPQNAGDYIFALAEDCNETIYISYTDHNYRKLRGDSVWQELHIPGDVSFLRISNDNYLYATTQYHGLYRSVDPLTNVSPPQFVALPMTIELQQNYPNPFNSSTTITFSLPHQSETDISLFDLTGRQVRTLIHGEISAGTHQTIFDGSRLATGTYFVRLRAGSEMQVKKVVLLK